MGFLSVIPWPLLLLAAIIIGIPVIAWLLGVRYIPHNRVGIVEKLWSATGSLKDGHMIVTDGRAGFQANMLRGGLHFGFFPWQYRIHKERLVMIDESHMGYVYARDGQALPPTQTLGRTVECNSFQNALDFLKGGGQRGRQRAILREGLYAINTAQFVVVTADQVFCGPVRDKDLTKYSDWQSQLRRMHGFRPVIIKSGRDGNEEANDHGLQDSIGVVTVHDGPSIESEEIIAPEVEDPSGNVNHNNFQDIESFLELGGRRGKQLQVLTDGTYFINRWFATVEMHPKTLIPIGYVGVVVSYHGNKGEDVTGVGFRYGEQVEPGRRGVWKRALPPGKYALNPYALKMELVPTVNFVLRWITGQTEDHHYDEDLSSIDLITADGYEPVLPLSLVVHIDYEKAPSVIQRFGDVKRLISQTLDPILSSYFRDVAQSTNMLDLLTHRDEIQRRATEELGRRFKDYDINCIAVLIGRPESKVKAGQDDPIEGLFDQLRMRRLAQEQIDTYSRQQEAAVKQRELNDARAAAEKQTELTQTKINIEVAANKGEAQLAEAQRLAKRDVALAEGEARKRVTLAESESRAKELLAQGEGRAKELIGKGEASRIAQVGMSEAAVNLQKIRAFGDSRLFALNAVSEQLAHSTQPLVPQRLLVMNGAGSPTENGQNPYAGGLLGQLLGLLIAEKSGLGINGDNKHDLAELDALAKELARRQAQIDVPQAAVIATSQAGNGSGAARRN